MQKCINWPKTFKNCSQKWDKICVEGGLHPRKRCCLVFNLDYFFRFQSLKKYLESNFATNVFVIIL